jgi:superfamily I DNA and/or RNA helicase
MAYTSYLVRKFEYTHENLFFKKFSDELKKIYSEQQGEQILIGNLSCNGHQIDAIFLKRGQITVIDFKDYEGTLNFSENNPWRIVNSNGEPAFVAGGAQMRNPFQQVRAYRFSLFQYLSDHENEILSANRNDIKWDHTGCIVLFQNSIEFDSTTIPGSINRYFHIADINSIYDILDSRYSGNLEFSDNEIFSILKILDIRPENLLEKINLQVEDYANGNKGSHAEKLTMIKRLIHGSREDSEYNRILNYYRTIINVERFKEPTASELQGFPANFKNEDLSKYTINISATKEFHQIFIENLEERFPKNLFVGLNINIDGQNYPVLHTIVLASDIKNMDNVIINLNDFELYPKSLEQLGLTEDIVEELTTAINQMDTLEKKLQALRDQLSISAELTQSFQVGLSTESLFSSQLLSELRKLNEIDENEISSSLYKSFLRNDKIQFPNSILELNSFTQITPLNNAQKKAIQLSFKQPLTVVTGPPGTGKSQLVMNLIANALMNGYSVLFASKNNKAVDNVKDRLDELLNEQYLLRFGSKDEVTNNTKPTISKFISRKNQGQFHNRETELYKVREEINDTINRQDRLIGFIDRIPKIERQLPELKNNLEFAKEKRQQWLKDMNPTSKSIFIDDNLTIDIDKNRIALIIQRINRLYNGLFGKLMFQLFYKSGIQSQIDDINNKLPSKIKEFVQKNAPWADLSKHLLLSIEDNLRFLLKQKEEEGSVRELNKRHLDSIEELSRQIISLEMEVAELRKNEKSYIEEMQNIENKLPVIGIEAMNLLSEQKLNDLSSSEVQHYLDYLPANNVWRYEELTDFAESCLAFLKNFKAVCVTSLSIKNSFSLSNSLFDLLIVDEASQCDIASALPLVFRANKVVIIGDPLQLKHITSVQPNEEKYIIEGLNLENYQFNFVSNSLYDYSYSLANKSLFESVFLDEHYRCHPEIIQFSKTNFYERKLGQTLKIRTTNDGYAIEPKGVQWIHVKGEMHKEKNINLAEVNSCIDLAQLLAKKHQDASIGIVTPFRDQYKIIFERLPSSIKERVKVDTVHKYQGDEKDIIIFSTVVASNCSPSKARFINRNDYLINVAITRAKNTLYIIGDHEYCLKLRDGKIRTPLSLLADYAKQLNKVT